MPHIHTKTGQYDFTISAFIVRQFDDELKVLLHMHRKHYKLLPVGGHIELDETPWEGLRHELFEESGYALEALDVLQPLERVQSSEYQHVTVQPIPIHINAHEIDPASSHYHTDLSYALVAVDDPGAAPAEGESLDLRWLTREELLAVPEDVIWQNTRVNALSVLDLYFRKWKRVPARDFLG